MTVRSYDGKFAKAPWLIADTMNDFCSTRTELPINFVDIFNEAVCEIGMVARLASPQGIGAFAEHYFEIAKREEFPSRCGEIPVETESIFEIGRRYGQAFYCQYVTRVYNFSIRHSLLLSREVSSSSSK